jgi:hypothetical protein
MLGLEVLAAFLLLALKRLGQVLNSYRTSVLSLIERSPDRDEPWARLPGPSSSYLASTQGAAEAVLYASLFVFLAALLGGGIRSHVASDLTSVVCWIGFGLGLVVAGACLRKAGLPRRY